jgi:hypothetical protein
MYVAMHKSTHLFRKNLLGIAAPKLNFYKMFLLSEVYIFIKIGK